MSGLYLKSKKDENIRELDIVSIENKVRENHLR